VCASGRKAAYVRRQYNAWPNQHRRLCSAHRCHIAVVSPSNSGRLCCIYARLRRIPGRYRASTALPAGINGTAVDAR